MEMQSSRLMPEDSSISDAESISKNQMDEKMPSKKKIIAEKSLLGKIFPILCNLCLFASMIFCIVAGILRAPIRIAQEQIMIGSLSIQFSEDLQITLIGVVSKIIDYFLSMSIEHLAGITITSMMIGNLSKGNKATPEGASSLDFELANEMTKPWLAAYNFHKRIKRFGFASIGVWGSVKFILTLLVAFTVLLMTAAINTVALPKQRWTPEVRYCTPAERIIRLTYEFIENQAYNMGLSLTNVESRAATLLASQTWMTTSNIWYTVATHDYWQALATTNSNTADTFPVVTAIKTYQNETVTFSVRLRKVQDLYTRVPNSADYFGKVSQGYAGVFNITVPSLTTSCKELSAPQGNDTYLVRTNPIDASGRPSLRIILGPSSQYSEFKGANCSLLFRQMYHTPTGWYPSSSGNTADYVSLDTDLYGNRRDYTPTPLPVTQYDAGIVANLTNTLNTTLPAIDDLTNGFVSFMAILVRAVEGRISDSPSGAGAVAVGLAAIAQQTISLGNFLDTDTDEEICSMLRWEVYGSGPRLPWQWAIGAFLGFGILIAFVDFLAWFHPKVYVAEWIDVFGMLSLANGSPKLDAFSEDKGVAERALLYVVETDDGEVELRERKIFKLTEV
ncbi:hypothetical protein H072_2636 [Dactylellina haptotyla CBS 200.50]|uniref:Uncharacterized protein n=1 Tax=Dactylellina haptotyla (strain CBS 200.50) TaxID=1284197 RepID=S8AQN2_DACHA|nr:hypothetical protein H072_2636 [Dactylellina haptotyla CBS 200.50]